MVVVVLLKFKSKWMTFNDLRHPTEIAFLRLFQHYLIMCNLLADFAQTELHWFCNYLVLRTPRTRCHLTLWMKHFHIFLNLEGVISKTQFSSVVNSNRIVKIVFIPNYYTLSWPANGLCVIYCMLYQSFSLGLIIQFESAICTNTLPYDVF